MGKYACYVGSKVHVKLVVVREIFILFTYMQSIMYRDDG
jgi:heme exporter protein D